jgi:hypothetical protein
MFSGFIICFIYTVSKKFVKSSKIVELVKMTISSFRLYELIYSIFSNTSHL